MIPAGLTHLVPIKIGLSIAAMVWCNEHFPGNRWIIAGYVGEAPDELAIWAFADPHEAFAFKLQFG